MAKSINSQQSYILFVDLEKDDDDEVIEIIPSSSHSEERILNPSTDKNLHASKRQEHLSSEVDQSKIIQQCLALLLHAQKCNIIQEEMREVQIQCVQSQCSTVKKLLKHQETCSKGQECTVQRCNSSRMILRHWNNCKRQDCQLCSPVRRKFNIQIPIQPDQGYQSSDIQFSSPSPLSTGIEMNKNSSAENINVIPNIVAKNSAKTSNLSLNLPASTQIPRNTSSIRDLTFKNRKSGKHFPSTSIMTSSCWKTFPSHRSRYSNSRYKSYSQPQYRRSFKSTANFKRTFRNFHRNASRSEYEEEKRNLHSNTQSLFTMPTMTPTARIRNHIMMVIHACKCQKRQEENSGPPCTSEACKTTRILLNHVKICKNTVRCPVQHCISLKNLLIHLNRCVKDECLLCAPLKKKRYAFFKTRGSTGRSSQDQ